LVLDSRKPQQFPQLSRVEQVPGRAYINDLNQFHVSIVKVTLSLNT